jgi:pimeloyl-ACP methyl ester carboxylesterase
MTGQSRCLRLAAWCLVGCVAWGGTGCTSIVLSNLAVKAPNLQRVPRAVRDPKYAARFDAVAAETWKLSVGPPAAELAVAVVEPGNYQFRYDIELKQNPKTGHKWLEPKFDWTLPPTRLANPPRGTVLLLHGYGDARENMMHWALCLAHLGYRSVLVDLRGHGRSTGDLIGYGAFETQDLTQLLDELQKRNIFESRLGVLGISYGGSLGLLLAAHDPRVATVVALEPYSAASTGVVEFAHGISPRQAAKISDATFASAVARAAKKGHFSWSDGDVLAAMPKLTSPVLLVHGEKDRWLSPDNSRRLIDAAPEGSKLILLADDDHLILSMRLANVAEEVQTWFETYLASPPVAVATAKP